MATKTRTRKTRTPKPYTQKAYAPGDVLLWTDWDGTEHIGTVWCDGPKVGTRWAIEDDGSIALLKPWMSGRRAGQIDQDRRFPPDWQGRVIRTLDLLHRSMVWHASTETHYSDPPLAHLTYLRKTVHISPECADEHDDRGAWTKGYYRGPGGTPGRYLVKQALRGGTDARGNERDPLRAVESLMAELCPKCIPTAESVAA
jgi:hypothetical protein